MKQLFSLIFSKLLAALPKVVESNESFYRQQIIILQRTLLSKGVKRILATPEEIRQLLAIGKQLDHQIDGKLLIGKRPTKYRLFEIRAAAIIPPAQEDCHGPAHSRFTRSRRRSLYFR